MLGVPFRSVDAGDVQPGVWQVLTDKIMISVAWSRTEIQFCQSPEDVEDDSEWEFQESGGFVGGVTGREPLPASRAHVKPQCGYTLFPLLHFGLRWQCYEAQNQTMITKLFRKKLLFTSHMSCGCATIRLGPGVPARTVGGFEITVFI